MCNQSAGTKHSLVGKILQGKSGELCVLKHPTNFPSLYFDVDKISMKCTLDDVEAGVANEIFLIPTLAD